MKEMFMGLFKVETSSLKEIYYNNLEARVIIASKPIYTKNKHLEEDPSRRGIFY
jgi:hypothetical protein